MHPMPCACGPWKRKDTSRSMRFRSARGRRRVWVLWLMRSIWKLRKESANLRARVQGTHKLSEEVEFTTSTRVFRSVRGQGVLRSWRKPRTRRPAYLSLGYRRWGSSMGLGVESFLGVSRLLPHEGRTTDLGVSRSLKLLGTLRRFWCLAPHGLPTCAASPPHPPYPAHPPCPAPPGPCPPTCAASPPSQPPPTPSPPKQYPETSEKPGIPKVPNIPKMSTTHKCDTKPKAPKGQA